MDEFYQIIEAKIKDSGYLPSVNGLQIYNELSDFIEDKETGSYLFLSNKDGETVFEYKVDVLHDDFNLSYINITENGNQYHVDFDN